MSEEVDNIVIEEVKPIDQLVEESSRLKTKCSFHTTEYYNSFCKDCQTPICAQCRLSLHKQHNTINITLEDFTTKLSVFSTLNAEATDRVQDKEHLLELMAQLEDSNKSCKLLIQERFKELQFIIKQREMNLEKERQKEYEAAKLELTKRINLVDKDLSHVQTQWEKSKQYQQSTPQELYNNSMFEVLEQYSLSDKKVRHIQSSDFHHLKPLDVPVKFTLEMDGLKKQQVLEELSTLGVVTHAKQSAFRPSKQTQAVLPTSPTIVSVTPSSSNSSISSNNNNEDDKKEKKNNTNNNNNKIEQVVSNIGTKYIYSIGGWNDNGTDLSSTYKYDIEKNEWRLLKNTLVEALPFVASSVVNDGKHIYVFGGTYEVATYRRFNISKQAWDKPEKMTRGGGGVAAQYDGKKYIYIFGGKLLDESKPYHQIVQRIERFNTSTKTFESMGSMSKHKYSCFTCFDGRYIYLIGGQVVNGRACKEIERFDTVELKSSVYASLGGGGLVQGCCIDPSGESIYYITQTSFKRFTISTKSFETLPFPVLSETSCRPTLIFDSKSKIFLLDQFDNYVYDLATSKWTKFQYTRKNPICGQGCIISNS